MTELHVETCSHLFRLGLSWGWCQHGRADLTPPALSGRGVHLLYPKGGVCLCGLGQKMVFCCEWGTETAVDRHIIKNVTGGTKMVVLLRTPEQIPRYYSSLLCPVKVRIKTHDGKSIPFCHSVLVCIVKIQMKSHGSISDL